MLHNHLLPTLLRQRLTLSELRELIEFMVKPECPPAQIAAAITLLSMRPYRGEELAAIAKVFLHQANTFTIEKPCIDTCGTGGDDKRYFNVSTVASFIVAAANVPVLKHGNRAASGSSGSSDFFEKAGATLSADNNILEQQLNASNFSFVFAPLFHPLLKTIGKIRSELKIRTIFNALGPLIHPANIHYQLLGISDAKLLKPMAEAVSQMNRRRAMVIHGQDGCDEASPFSPTDYIEVCEGKMVTGIINPEDFSLAYSPSLEATLQINDPAKSYQLGMAVLSGEIKEAPRAICLLNAALALYVARAQPTIEDCVQAATEALDSKKAKRHFDLYIQS